MRKGFTLAEVLITLGIIGIVAALTIPTLITKYQKKVASTHLKKFVSTYTQAMARSVEDNGIMDGTNIFTIQSSPEQTLEWYNKFINPYLKTLKIEKTTYGIIVYMTDGSGMLMSNNAAPTTQPHLLYCIKSKYCEEYSDRADIWNIADGKNLFLFIGGYDGTIDSFIFKSVYKTGYDDNGNTTGILTKGTYTRDEALEFCRDVPRVWKRNCTRLLYMDNWEFKDDYPW